jgi:signal transduction histidine kinase
LQTRGDRPGTLERYPFLQGGGELGALIAQKDWSTTPLGPIATWPQSLRTSLGILLNSQHPMFVFWGPQLIKIYNDAYRPITGHKHPWALGRPAPEVWPEIWDDIKPLVDRALAGHATWSDDLMLFMERNGFPEEVYFTFSYSPIPDDALGIAGMFCACTETTRRVLGERRLRTLRDLAAAPAEARTIADACRLSAAVLAANPQDIPFALIYLTADGAGLHQAGHTGFDTLAEPGRSALLADHGAASWPLQHVIETRRSVRLSPLSDLLAAVPPGPWPEPPADAIVLPLIDKGLERAVGAIVLGISVRRPFDAEYREWLELVAGQVSSSITNARAAEDERRRAEALAEIDRAKTTFFSNVSHEFRTPLTLLLGPMADALERSDRALAGPELETSYRNAQRLLKLVNGLLDFARIEAGRLQASFEPTDLARLTEDLASVFRSAIERAGLTFTVECDHGIGEIYVDRDMWERIVLNLLSNALKFTFDGRIRVTLLAVPAGAELRIADTGIGIAPDDLPHVFERFRRIEGVRARTHEGSGIGLALVQEFVRLHGGTLRVDSVPGHGTTFAILIKSGTAHLPPDRIGVARSSPPMTADHRAFVDEALRWLPGSAEPQGSALHESQGGARLPADRRIVIADDNADMRDYLVRLLGATWRVEAVANGADALAALRREPANLLIADVMMPVLDGVELIREVRADAALREIPVLLLSARAGEEARIEGLEAGADDYVCKPFSARELVARVASHLAQAGARAAAGVERDRLRSLLSDHVLALRQLEDQTTALTAAREAAEVASRVKDEFLAILGHELRNPLAPILTALQLMRLRGRHSREQDVIERQVSYLTRLVDDLLDVSRITRGKIELHQRPTELGPVVVRAMELAGPLLEQRQQQVDIEVADKGLLVSADADRLAQVITNLLTNAAKYSDPGSRIVVAAHTAGDLVELSIRDQGVGIAREMLGRIFEPFVQQAQTMEQSRGGLGLGLTIVKSLVEKHGGSVSVRSEGPDRGSEFVVRLPRLRVAESAAAASGDAEAGSVQLVGAGERILVVDDNQDAAEMIQYVLQQLGHTVAVAHDGPQALGAAATLRPTVALLDIGLPVMDGYELAEQLRQAGYGDGLRLFAITGYGQEADRERSAALGFEAHLVKPVDLMRLHGLIART